jgi:hypothetical protein
MTTADLTAKLVEIGHLVGQRAHLTGSATAPQRQGVLNPSSPVSSHSY